MEFAFNEDEAALKASARRFLEARSSSPAIRSAMNSPGGFDPDLWKALCQELGWAGLIIPEAYGGVDFGYVGLVALMEEMGRVLLCAPYFSTVALATNALLIGGDEAQKQAYLPAIAAGELMGTVAHTEADGRWEPASITTEARREGNDYLLSGRKLFVMDGHSADLLLTSARAPGSSGQDGISLFAIPRESAGLRSEPLATLDMTRRQASIELDAVRVPASACLGGEGNGWPILSQTMERAIVASSAEQVGGASRCLEMAVDYAKVRVQFGRAIGSFQAIKHKCADMMLRVESARSASYFAGWTVDNAPEELALSASQAKAYCSEAFFHCAAENIQIHGGIGFTWEHDAHLFFKRSRSSLTLLGDPRYHRSRFADAMGL